MKNFLQNNRVVSSAPTRKKTALIGTNNNIKNRPEAVNQDFGNKLVNNIAKAYRSEVFVGIVRVGFGNEGNESIINSGIKGTYLERGLHQVNDIISNDVSVLFEKNT